MPSLEHSVLRSGIFEVTQSWVKLLCKFMASNAILCYLPTHITPGETVIMVHKAQTNQLWSVTWWKPHAGKAVSETLLKSKYQLRPRTSSFPPFKYLQLNFYFCWTIIKVNDLLWDSNESRQALSIQTCQQFQKSYWTGLPASLREHSTHSFQTLLNPSLKPEPTPALPQSVFHSSRFTTFIPRAVTSTWLLIFGIFICPVLEYPVSADISDCTAAEAPLPHAECV